MNIRPLGERVLVKVVEAEEKTFGGIVLPDTAKEKPQRGVVLAVGAGRLLENGQVVPCDVKVGDTVLFSKYSGVSVKDGNEEVLFLMGDRDILGVLVD